MAGGGSGGGGAAAAGGGVEVAGAVGGAGAGVLGIGVLAGGRDDLRMTVTPVHLADLQVAGDLPPLGGGEDGDGHREQESERFAGHGVLPPFGEASRRGGDQTGR